MNEDTKTQIKNTWEASQEKTAEKLFEIISGDKAITADDVINLDFASEEIKKDAAKMVLMRKLQPWTIKEHVKFCKEYTSLDDFTPTGYLTENGEPTFSCKRGTITTIAGRSGHGKSQLLVQLCADAIKQQEDKEKRAQAQGKKIRKMPVIFFSLEMTKEQVARRFIRNLMHHEAIQDGVFLPDDITYRIDDVITIIEKLTEYESELDGSKRALHLENLKNKSVIDEELLKSYNIIEKKQTGNFSDLYKYYEQAISILQEWENENRLMLIDLTTAGSTIKEIEYVAKYFEGSILFIDYMQRINDDSSASQDYISIKHICNGLSQTVIKNNQIVIIASQFNRSFSDDDNTYPSELQLTKLSEGSDIEKISQNVIGFSYITTDTKNNTRQYYYKVMKQREGGHDNQSYKCNAYLGYSTIIPALDEKEGVGIKMNETANKSNVKTAANETTQKPGKQPKYSSTYGIKAT